MKNSNKLLFMSLLILNYVQINAMTIDTDTLYSIATHGIRFVVNRSIEQGALACNKDATIKDMGFYKVCMGATALIFINDIKSREMQIAKTIAATVVLEGFMSLFVEGKKQPLPVTEVLPAFMVNGIISPLAVDALHQCGCPKSLAHTTIGVTKGVTACAIVLNINKFDDAYKKSMDNLSLSLIMDSLGNATYGYYLSTKDINN